MANEKVITTSALIEKFQQALNEKWGYIWGTAGVEWTKARQEALEKTTDADRAQGRKYGSKWIGRMVADCSGLFSWAFRKLGGTMYHGSDTMYRKYCVNKGMLKKGLRTDGKPLLPGTAVFVYDGKKYKHVGLYVGNNTVIEAMSTIKGVTTTSLSAVKWTHWGELKGVDYGKETTTVPSTSTASGNPTLKRGSKNSYVTVLQTMLKMRGYDLGKYGVDGDFGKATEAAVMQFQKEAGLKVDGIVGPSTWEALENNVAVTKMYTILVPDLSKEKAEELLSRLSTEFSGVRIYEG